MPEYGVFRCHVHAGSRGKTTTSWLVRGIFEEMQLVTGMIGSLEYSIAVDKMTADGNLWMPDEEDPTLRRCAAIAGRFLWSVKPL